MHAKSPSSCNWTVHTPVQRIYNAHTSHILKYRLITTWVKCVNRSFDCSSLNCSSVPTSVSALEMICFGGLWQFLRERRYIATSSCEAYLWGNLASIIPPYLLLTADTIQFRLMCIVRRKFPGVSALSLLPLIAPAMESGPEKWRHHATPGCMMQSTQ